MGDFNDVSSLVEKLRGRFCFRKAEISRQIKRGSGLLFAPLIRISEVFIYEAGIELPVLGMKEGLVLVRLSNRTLRLNTWEVMISSIQVLILQLTLSGSLSIRVFTSFRMAMVQTIDLARGNLRIITGFLISLSFNCCSVY
ncbi:hypothetical protein Peur_057197 [Populus x canadensis]